MLRMCGSTVGNTLGFPDNLALSTMNHDAWACMHVPGCCCRRNCNSWLVLELEQCIACIRWYEKYPSIHILGTYKQINRDFLTQKQTGTVSPSVVGLGGGQNFLQGWKGGAKIFWKRKKGGPLFFLCSLAWKLRPPYKLINERSLINNKDNSKLRFDNHMSKQGFYIIF